MSAKEKVEGKDKSSLSCGVFLLRCFLRQACKNPCCVRHFPCPCPSHQLKLSLIHSSSVASSFFQLHFDFHPRCLSVFPSLSLCFMLACIAVLPNLHSKDSCANAVLLSQSGCLSVFFSLPHHFSWSLATSDWMSVCFYFFLCTFLAALLCLPLPPTLCLLYCNLA